MSPKHRISTWATVAAILFGLAAGIGAYTFRYAEGLSYFSTDPKACANCHIMQPQFDGWQHSSHHAVAVCVDCHLPHDFLPKYVAKAEHGWNHSVAFTLQNFAEPIRMTQRSADAVQANCARCHSASRGFDEYLIYGTNTNQRIENGMDCATCHTTFDTFETRRITSVEFPSGKSTPNIPATTPTDDPEVRSNMCITCHQGRTSMKDIDEAIAADNLRFPELFMSALLVRVRAGYVESRQRRALSMSPRQVSSRHRVMESWSHSNSASQPVPARSSSTVARASSANAA